MPNTNGSLCTRASRRMRYEYYSLQPLVTTLNLIQKILFDIQFVEFIREFTTCHSVHFQNYFGANYRAAVCSVQCFMTSEGREDYLTVLHEVACLVK
jgi:hypothetical protein